jgi:flavin reductase (DIM6/NTAB) family NADH-FMN oxidoreductase RutF
MPVSQDLFKQIMRRWTNGVTIVTTRRGGEVHGLTVSGFTGVSLEPPLVLVSIGHNQHSFEWIRQGRCFGINFLRSDQAALSNRFASRELEGEERFAGVSYRTEVTGAPILDECLAWFDCRVAAEHVVGDHTLFIGEIAAGAVARDAAPLVYFNGDYRLLLIDEQATPATLAGYPLKRDARTG